MNHTIAGADGCRAGWVVIQESMQGADLEWQVVPSLEALFSVPTAPGLLALDIPIGIPPKGSRACDVQARRLLGSPRGRSVFPAPIRPMLTASTHAEASAIGRNVEGRGLTIQAWGIVPKIREVDELLRADARIADRVREVHPEVCFYFLGGERPMKVGKKEAAGREERAALLREHFGGAVDRALADVRWLGCAADDLLDAFAGLWTARRIQAGTAVRIPASPERDSHRLPMEIVA